MVQRLTRIKELNGKLSRPPHYAHGTSRDHTYTMSSKRLVGSDEFELELFGSSRDELLRFRAKPSWCKD